MIRRITNYFVLSYEEARKVVWPNRREVTNHSLIVVISILISMAIIAAIDYGLFNLLQILLYQT